MRRRGTIVALLVLITGLALHAAFPSPQGAINDFARILDANARTQLAKLADDVRTQTTAEIAVVTVTSLDGMTVEEYANKLFKAWGIGKKGKDNGVLILVAPTERKIRIEVGYGLEPVLPDGLAGQIIRTDVLPEFKAGDYPGGILKGTRHIAEVVQRNHTLTLAEREAIAAAARPSRLPATRALTVVVMMGGWLLGAGLRSKTVLPTLLGGLFAILFSAFSIFVPSVAAPWIVVPAAAAMVAFGWKTGAAKRWQELGRGGGTRRTAGSGWVMGNEDSSSESGSSSSRSSGDFGGGSSGGGGASGSW